MDWFLTVTCKIWGSLQSFSFSFLKKISSLCWGWSFSFSQNILFIFGRTVPSLFYLHHHGSGLWILLCLIWLVKKIRAFLLSRRIYWRVGFCFFNILGYSVQFSHSLLSDSLWPHGLQHAMSSHPSTTPGVYPNSYPLSQWCHPAISSSVIPFSSCP